MSLTNRKTAGRSQVSKFGGAKYIFRGRDFCYMFKTHISGHNTIWGNTKNIWGTLAPNAPRGYGPAPQTIPRNATLCSSFKHDTTIWIFEYHFNKRLCWIT